MKYFLYARKSTDTEDKQVLSIQSQLNEVREFAKKQDLEVVREFQEARTAKSPGRPIFNEMIKRINFHKKRIPVITGNAKFDAILTRNWREMHRLKERINNLRLKARGIFSESL